MYRTWQTYDLGWAYYGSYSQPIDIRTGSGNPRWKELISAHKPATNPYSRTLYPGKNISVYDVDWTWVALDVANKPRTAYLRGAVALNTLASGMLVYGISNPYLNLAYSVAKLAFLSKMREARNSFEALPFFGELKETIEMVRHPLNGIMKHTRSYTRSRRKLLARLNRSNAARIENRLEKAYLQWTYGVSPLIGDIKGLVDVVQKLTKYPEIERISVSIPIQDHVVRRSAGPSFFESGRIQFWSQHEIKADGKTRYVGAIKSTLKAGSFDRFNELSGLRLRDVVPAIYELTPYSFLVDYFSSLGDCIGGVFTDTSDMIYLVRSTKQRLSGDILVVGLPSDYKPVSFPMIPVSGHLEKVAFNRDIPDLTVAFDDLYWKHPTFTQWINTAVLGVQRMKSSLG